MTELQFVFILGAAITLVSALMVVTVKNLIHAAFYLILTLFGVAVLFVLLNATFLAVIQVVVYIGAIAILIIMAVMVTRNVTGSESTIFNTSKWVAALISALVGATLILGLSEWSQLTATASEVDTTTHVAQIGTELVGKYVVPFELASLLLLAALVGAIVIAWPRKKEEE
jgi:NADH-quinone oxidoreductase subunit J